MRGGYKWLLLVLLSLAYFFSQADRVLFGLLTIPIQEELHLTDLQIGFVNTALFVTLAFTVPLAMLIGSLSPLLIGAMSDRMGLAGFERGFALMGGAYVVGALAMAVALFFTFEKDHIKE